MVPWPLVPTRAAHRTCETHTELESPNTIHQCKKTQGMSKSSAYIRKNIWNLHNQCLHFGRITVNAIPNIPLKTPTQPPLQLNSLSAKKQRKPLLWLLLEEKICASYPGHFAHRCNFYSVPGRPASATSLAPRRDWRLTVYHQHTGCPRHYDGNLQETRNIRRSGQLQQHFKKG